jgi:hypothetical protein
MGTPQKHLLKLTVLTMGSLMLGCDQDLPTDSAATIQAVPRYHRNAVPGAIIHSLFIPSSSQPFVMPFISNELMTVDKFAQKTEAIAVLNGGFFDPMNQLSTSYITVQGQQVADPHQNPRLMENPELTAYLPQILNRSEFRQYRCGKMISTDITPKNKRVPKNCQLWNAMGAGPQLLPTFEREKEGFWIQQAGRVIRDPLGSEQRNARTAVGITARGDILWAMASQTTPDGGLTLPEMATFMQSQGAQKALNLDGGTSSAFYYRGKTFYGKVDAAGKPIQRPVKSVLILQENSIP